MKIGDLTITTLIFDVLGTVVDDAGSFARDCELVARESGLPSVRAEQLQRSWLETYDRIFDPVQRGLVPWRSQDSMMAQALAESVRVHDISLPEEAITRLSSVGHRYRPWPDAVEALQRLSEYFPLVALSNGNLSLLVDLSRSAGLPWDCVLSGQMVRAYKPNPDVYAMAIELLDLDPARSMMVAAHPWDLRGAAAAGLRTAYVARAGEGSLEPGDRFDLYADDLADLATKLIGFAS